MNARALETAAADNLLRHMLDSDGEIEAQKEGEGSHTEDAVGRREET
jgi:hypothetical protein